MGWLITICGSDGAGKTTLIKTLSERVARAGETVQIVTVRLGFTPLISRLKKAAGLNETNLSSTVSTSPEKKKSVLKRMVRHIYRLGSLIELIGLFAWINLQRAVGRQLITDRFYYDNLIIYREKYGQLGWLARALWAAARLAAGKPDAAFLLIVPAEESYRRILKRTQGVAEESPEVMASRARMYAELDQTELVTIDALQPPEQVVQMVWDTLGEYGWFI